MKTNSLPPGKKIRQLNRGNKKTESLPKGAHIDTLTAGESKIALNQGQKRKKTQK